MDLEKLWYEISPYAYFILGIVALIMADSKMAYVSAALLISAAFTILTLRRHYRAAEKDSIRT